MNSESAREETELECKETELERKERHLRLFLWVLSAGFLLSILGYLYGGFVGDGEFPFVANSTAKDGLFLALSLLAIADVRRFGWLAWLVMLGHAILAVTLITIVVTGNVNMAPIEIGPITVDAWIIALAWGLVDVAIVIGLYRLLSAVGRLRGPLWYLSTLQFEIVKGLGKVLIPDEHRRVTPERIAHNVDVYLDKFNAKGKSKVKGGLMALAPFAALSPDRGRGWLEKMTKGEGWFSRRLGKLLQPMIGVGAQVVYFGYYGDPVTFEAIGYKRFVDRPDYWMKKQQVVPHEDRARVTTEDPEAFQPDRYEVDHVIVGSGAAGAILAYELAARGRSVLVLERGKHVDPEAFNDVETNMLSNLYSDGAIQISRDLRFAVLQGMCVGGSTVVNNAVCIKAPDDVLGRWNDAGGLNAGIDPKRLNDSYRHIESWLRVRRQPKSVVAGGAEKFLDGADRLGLKNHVHVVEANIVDCLGCGYCNIGCKFGKKLSMLDTVLPWAQKEFGEKVRILPECYAERIETNGPNATVLCQVGEKGRPVRIAAKESVIVSAGAVNSSLLLRRSKIRLSVAGKGLAFNMATPLTAHFNEKLNSYDGLQISHYLEPPGKAGYVLETWFNPPAMQSLFMPGWSTDHYRNMDQYDQMACAGVVVGTRSNGTVRRGLLGNFEFKPGEEDLRSLMSGVKQLAKIFLAAGATRVMPSTFKYRSFKPGDDLDPLYDYVANRTGISLNSAHPQGGNAISISPDKGVVDQSFKVHGLGNVYVCDASVFPSSITVNPQYTVMALAHYAAKEITGEDAPKRARPPLEARFGDPPTRAPDEPRVTA